MKTDGVNARSSQESSKGGRKGLPSIKLYYRQQKPGQAAAGKHHNEAGCKDPLQSDSPPSFSGSLSKASGSISPLLGSEDSDKPMAAHTAPTAPTTTTTSAASTAKPAVADLASLGTLISRFCVQRHISSQLIEHLEDLLLGLDQNKVDRAKVKEFTGFLCALLETIIYNEAKRIALQKADAEIDFSDWLGRLEFTTALFSAALISFFGHDDWVRHQISGTNPFEVLMVLETVIRCGVPDSAGVKRLQELEGSLLEEGVWDHPHVFQMLEAENSRNSLMESPRKAIRSMTSTASSTGGLTRLELFFRKYFRLVVARIDKLTSRLNLSPAAVFPTALWSAFVGLIESSPALAILRHRHLDQILGALTYSVCKFYDNPRSFREIIAAMQPMPEARYKAIWMGEGEARADLVAFYNAVFLPAIRAVIHSLPPKEELDEAASEDPTTAAVPKTPKPSLRRRANSISEPTSGSPSRIHPIPSAHSPISASSHLTKRVHFNVSPMKHHLSRTIPHTMTPTKLHISTSGTSAQKRQRQPSASVDDGADSTSVTEAADTLINVARRLEF